MNAFAHCYGCHQKYGSNPDYFVRHYIDTYGEGSLELVREKAEDITLGKRMNKEQKEIAKHYKEEAARMENDRAAGVVGWLEFISWD
jgi:mono/diheme cytochrome c family protein|tara:strand:- start:1879 stop:2139 length:261 start_codon:yes stop_codon:yes gene_type:complete